MDLAQDQNKSLGLIGRTAALFAPEGLTDLDSVLARRVENHVRPALLH